MKIIDRLRVPIDYDCADCAFFNSSYGVIFKCKAFITNEKTFLAYNQSIDSCPIQLLKPKIVIGINDREFVLCPNYNPKD